MRKQSFRVLKTRLFWMFEIGGELALGQWQSDTKLFDQLNEELNQKIQVQIQPNASKVFVDECSHG